MQVASEVQYWNIQSELWIVWRPFTSPADTLTHMCKQPTTTTTAAKSSQSDCLLKYRELLKHTSGKQVELDLFQMVNINPSEMTAIED